MGGKKGKAQLWHFAPKFCPPTGWGTEEVLGHWYCSTGADIAPVAGKALRGQTRL